MKTPPLRTLRANIRDTDSAQDQMAAIQKAQNFYDRILDGFGDDSIGELGGAHLAVEGISLLGGKNDRRQPAGRIAAGKIDALHLFRSKGQWPISFLS